MENVGVNNSANNTISNLVQKQDLRQQQVVALAAPRIVTIVDGCLLVMASL